ncbi:MAG: ribosomal protein S18-alanine N-acetyltransferase [Candidatus Latescibacterota bacterium]|jgi:ribosomal-protein-alanine N-acetyltransferase
MVEATLETLRPVHIAAVVEIEHEAFTSPWTAEMFQQEVEENSFSRSYVALVEGRVAGYFVAWFLRREVHLLNIAVARSQQRRGLGRFMLRFLLDTAIKERKDMITLEVRESNEAAIRLYRSFGFSPIGIRRQYYQDDKENALLMSRNLSGWNEGP